MILNLLKKYHFIYRFINSFWDEIKIISNEKLPNIQKIESQMLSSDRNLRPNCGEILERRGDWSFSHENFNDDFSPNHIIIECLKLESKEKSFSYKFIEQKFKNLNCGKYKKLKNIFLQVLIYEHSFVEYLKDSKFSCGLEKYRKKFEEMNLIAIGTYGIVCKAMDRKTNKMFAIKKIPFDGGLSDPALKEIEIMLKLKSHLICKLESVFVENNYLNSDDYKNEMNLSSVSNNEIFKTEKPFLLHIKMEFCLMSLKELIKLLNKELDQKLNEVMTPLGYYISSELFKEILESVDYLHKQKVIHRDLKPNNILITDGTNGRFVKITDFGLATIHEFEGQSHTKYTGTQRYVAPEVMSSRKYDTKADIYSLGLILQELFNIDINEYLKYKSFFEILIFYFLFEFFFIRSSMMIINNSLLNKKYNNVIKSICEMMSAMKSTRPTCEQLLNNKSLWAFSLTFKMI